MTTSASPSSRWACRNYVGDHNVFHNDNQDRAVAVAYTDEFTTADLASGAWTTYSGEDANSLVETSATALFVSPASDDLHMVSDAVAVDAGTAIDAPSEDYDGNPRPLGTGYDIGAYELGVPIFSDGFETGTTSKWSAAVP